MQFSPMAPSLLSHCRDNPGGGEQGPEYTSAQAIDPWLYSVVLKLTQSGAVNRGSGEVKSSGELYLTWIPPPCRAGSRQEYVHLWTGKY